MPPGWTADLQVGTARRRRAASRIAGPPHGAGTENVSLRHRARRDKPPVRLCHDSTRVESSRRVAPRQGGEPEGSPLNLRCYAFNSERSWEAICVDFDIAVSQSSLVEVQSSLKTGIELYLEEVADANAEDHDGTSLAAGRRGMCGRISGSGSGPMDCSPVPVGSVGSRCGPGFRSSVNRRGRHGSRGLPLGRDENTPWRVRRRRSRRRLSSFNEAGAQVPRRSPFADRHLQVAEHASTKAGA